LEAFLVSIVVAMLVVLLATAGAPGSLPEPLGGGTVMAAAPADDVPPAAPSDTVSEFYPESANLSDCVGLVEKPGCGSGSRGGWHQTAVFAVLFVGLGVILWRVSSGIRANRAVLDADIDIEIDADADR